MNSLLLSTNNFALHLATGNISKMLSSVAQERILHEGMGKFRDRRDVLHNPFVMCSGKVIHDVCTRDAMSGEQYVNRVNLNRTRLRLVDVQSYAVFDMIHIGTLSMRP